MTNDEMKKIIDNYVQAYNNFDLEAMKKDLSEDVVFKNTENGIITLTTNGIAEYEEVAKNSKDFFTSREQTILDYDFGENFTIIYFNFKAVLAVDFNDQLKTGDEFSVGGKSIFNFKDNKITVLEDYS